MSWSPELETSRRFPNLRHRYIRDSILIHVVSSFETGSWYLGQIRVSWLNLVILVGSGYFGWIWGFWLDLGILVGSGYFDWIWVFWLDLGILVGSGYFDWIWVF